MRLHACTKGAQVHEWDEVTQTHTHNVTQGTRTTWTPQYVSINILHCMATTHACACAHAEAGEGC